MTNAEMNVRAARQNVCDAVKFLMAALADDAGTLSLTSTRCADDALSMLNEVAANLLLAERSERTAVGSN